MGTVRIVGGTLRGRRLHVPDQGVRPTAERVREAVFDILGSATRGAAVLDLYAGTGAYGVEALSRGAARVEFVEGDARVAAGIRGGLEAMGLGSEVARVHVADLETGVLPPEARGPFRLVFLDPPYEGEDGARWLHALARGEVLEPGAILVYERRRGSAPAAPDAFRLATERRYGDTTVAIYRLSGPESPPTEGTT